MGNLTWQNSSLFWGSEMLFTVSRLVIKYTVIAIRRAFETRFPSSFAFFSALLYYYCIIFILIHKKSIFCGYLSTNSVYIGVSVDHSVIVAC